MTAWRAYAIGVLLLCVGATGCGQTDDRAEATAVAERFFTALESGDGAAACDQLSADARKTLEDDEQKPCAEVIGRQRIKPAAVAAVELYLTNAKADLANGDSAFLSLTAEGWRLSAAGCQPGDGPPADMPMDCRLEA